ncbi:MAG: hypothetical protein AB7P20_05290 [Rhizobiaceae bacterium]
MSAKVFLGKSVPLKLINPQRLIKQAEAVASKLTVPSGIEFAQFECDGRIYALSARLVVEVEAMSSRVPDIVIRQRSRPPAASHLKRPR